MTAEAWAVLTLAAYLVIAFALLLRDVLRCEAGPVVWLLYVVERTYVPLMFRWRANRRCPYPHDGGALIVANHCSPVDPLMLWMNHHLDGPRRPIRVIQFLMAREFAETRGMQWMFRAMRVIKVERTGRDMAAAREAYRRLKDGGLVGVFPEGRINTGEGLLPFTPGAAWLALKSEAPVYPVFIHNAPPGHNMVEPFRTPSRVRVTYGEPIDLSGYAGRKTTDELLEEVAELMRRRVAELGCIHPGPASDEQHPAADRSLRIAN